MQDQSKADDKPQRKLVVGRLVRDEVHFRCECGATNRAVERSAAVAFAQGLYLEFKCHGCGVELSGYKGPNRAKRRQAASRSYSRRLARVVRAHESRQKRKVESGELPAETLQ